MGQQAGHQRVEDRLATGAGAQVFVHGDPGFQLERGLLRQHAHQLFVAARQRHLADADAGAGADQGQLRQVAVGAQGEAVAAPGDRKALAGAAQEGRLGVVADQGVAGQVGQRGGCLLYTSWPLVTSM